MLVVSGFNFGCPSLVLLVVFRGSFRALDVWVFQFHAWLAGELRAAVRERGGLVGLVRIQLALVVGQWQWSAIFNQFQQLRWVSFRNYAGRTSTEWSQIPGLSRFDGGTTSRGEAHSGEISEHIGRDEPLVDFDRVFVGILWRFIGRENVGHAKGGGDEHSECERLHGDSNITLQNHNNHNDTKSALNWYAIF